ncbi:MAG TPA: MFS transporter [Pirellulales bacterium]|jgi:MFS family permease|nr:MFS transporter [Pirellulales bacterium]
MQSAATSLTTSSAEHTRPAARPSLRASFWFTYAANTSMMAAVSLLYRYADFVFSLGGTELRLGLIVGLGMIGSVLMRAFQGAGVDTYGARRIWLASSAMFVVSCLAHLLLTTAHSPAIFLLRIVWQTSVAGFFGASISYVAGRRSTVEAAEAIGTLGTSGFVGTVLGTSLGDRLLGAGLAHRSMFALAAAIGLGALFFAWLATRAQQPPLRRRRPPLVWLLKRYHPGAVLLMGLAAGLGLGLPPIFLRPYALELGIGQLGTFFYPYMLVAFVTRLAIRKLPHWIGIRGMMLLGLANLVIGILLLVPVREAWHLYLPAVFLGVAHACMFPAVVAGGSTAFPARYRGLGTAVMLAMFDLGNCIGPPVFGAVWQLAAVCGWPPFASAFVVAGGLLVACGAVYIRMTRGARQKARRAAPVVAELEGGVANIEVA